MSRLIDADTLMPLFIEKACTMKDRHGAKLGDEWLLNYNDIKDVIDNAPTVCNDNYSMGYQDGVKKVLSERPQGEWVVDEEHSITMTFYKCTNCNYFGGATHYRYCPRCGADMRKEAENE